MELCLDAMGLAVKLEDGNLDILYAAVAGILEQLNISTEDVRQSLDKYHHLTPKNTMGVVTGRTSFAMELKKA